MDSFRPAFSLPVMGTGEIDQPVRDSMMIYEKTNWQEFSLQDIIHFGTALLMGCHYLEAYEVFSHGAARVPENNERYHEWLDFNAGWAAWMADDKPKYEKAFADIFTDLEGKPLSRDQWSYTEWIAAYILGKGTLEEFQEHCKRNPRLLQDTHFYHGEKLLKAKEYGKAAEAYRTCVEESKKWQSYSTRYWATWRLKQIEEIRKAD